MSVNGTVPAPLLRFREDQEVTINVRNEMADESTSIHWHGLLVPWDMDGVPGVSFAGIPARQTFTYRFKLRQSGTYWYHSHSGAQEQIGLYGPLIIDPLEPEPYNYDRDYVVLLSDWTFEDPVRVMDRLKNQSTYYNFQQRTAVDFFRDVRNHGWRATLADRLMWGRMRMSATDILDVTGYRYTCLVNELSPELNWTGLFRPRERAAGGGARLHHLHRADGSERLCCSDTSSTRRYAGCAAAASEASAQNHEGHGHGTRGRSRRRC